LLNEKNIRIELFYSVVFSAPMKRAQLLLLLVFLTGNVFAQNKNLDKIIAIVGENIILHSDLDIAVQDNKRQNPDLPADADCNILEQMLGQKILSAQAARDSIIVSDEEVEGNIDNRIRYFISMYGSEEKLEEVSGKTIYQLKDEYRPVFKEQMTAQRMQQQIMAEVLITPQEVKTFFNTIQPEISKEVREYARKKLVDVRKDIVDGTSDFEMMAGIYSEDPGSRDKGGELGPMRREELVPEFASAAFRLQKGEISDIVRTKFGYHIIQMINRQGEIAQLRHILIKPQVTNVDLKLASKKADSIRAELMAKKLTFAQAVSEFSNDEQTKYTGGMIGNPTTGALNLQMDELDAAAAVSIQDLDIGGYSQAKAYQTPSGEKAVRILYLKSRTEPHKANLDDDYHKIKQVALQEKQNKYLMNWLEQRIPAFYVRIDDEYAKCPSVSKWIQASAKK